jgi:hypothetical protein
MPIRRRQRNDQLRREVNDCIAGVAETLGDEGRLLRFLCECSRSGCRAVIEMSLTDYQALGADRRRVVVSEHYDGSPSRIGAAGRGVYAVSD